MIGPVIGGVLDEIWGWQASFAFLLVSGVLVTVLCWRDLGETSAPSGLSLAAQVAQYPRLLASQRFWGYSLSAALASGCFFAYLGGAPFVGTQIFGLTSSQIGALFALSAMGYAAGNFLAGRYSIRMGMNRMVLVGTMVTTLACLLLVLVSLAGLMGPFWFFGLTLFMGLGNGISLPNSNAGILSVRPELAGTASGLGGAAPLLALSGQLELHARQGKTPDVGLFAACGRSARLLFRRRLVQRRALGLIPDDPHRARQIFAKMTQ